MPLHPACSVDVDRPSPTRPLGIEGALGVVISAVLALPLMAGEPPAPVLEPLLLEGDTILDPVGTVEAVGQFDVNDLGSWISEADTDDPDPDFDDVLVIDGTLVLREGEALPFDPPGATLGNFDSVTLDNAGRGGFNFFLDGVSDDSGVYSLVDPGAGFDSGTVLVWQEGDDAPGFPMGTPTVGFFDVKINDAGDLLVTASIDAAAIPSTVDRVLSIVTPDAAGGVAATTVVAAEGDVLPGQTDAITDFGTGFVGTAFNDLGHVLFVVELEGDDDAIYLFDGAMIEIAQENGPSPITGRPWQNLASAAVALNDAGDVVFRGDIAGDMGNDELLVLNGGILAQEGSALADIAPFVLTDLSGPLWVSERGEVFWYGEWNDPDTTSNAGWFRDDRLLVREGDVTGDGQTITRLWGFDNGFAVSNSGDFALVRATTVLDGLYRIDLGGIFGDGFESGDTTAWSSTTGTR